jgi:hypothetical protein
VIVNVISPAPRDIWDTVLAEDPFALEGRHRHGQIHCASPWVTQTPARMYEMSDGRKLVVPLLRRSVAGVSLFEGSNRAYGGVGGILASRGSAPSRAEKGVKSIVKRAIGFRDF